MGALPATPGSSPVGQELDGPALRRRDSGTWSAVLCLTFLFRAGPQVESIAIASLLDHHHPGLMGQQFQTGCFPLELCLLLTVTLGGLLVHEEEHDTAP